MEIRSFIKLNSVVVIVESFVDEKEKLNDSHLSRRKKKQTIRACLAYTLPDAASAKKKKSGFSIARPHKVTVWCTFSCLTVAKAASSLSAKKRKRV